jgi:hypothetical protein
LIRETTENESANEGYRFGPPLKQRNAGERKMTIKLVVVTLQLKMEQYLRINVFLLRMISPLAILLLPFE